MKILITILITSLFWFLAFNLYLGITEEFPGGYLDKYKTCPKCASVNWLACKDCEGIINPACKKCNECVPYSEIEGNKVDVTPFLQLIKAQTNRIACLKNKCIGFAPPGCD